MKITHKRRDSMAADRNIKYCKICSKCWEITSEDNYRKRDRKIVYYNNFPSYGKTKEACDSCKGVISGKYVMDKPFV